MFQTTNQIYGCLGHLWLNKNQAKQTSRGGPHQAQGGTQVQGIVIGTFQTSDGDAVGAWMVCSTVETWEKHRTIWENYGETEEHHGEIWRFHGNLMGFHGNIMGISWENQPLV